MVDPSALKTEVQTDPAILNYGTWATSADDDRIAALINDPTKRNLPNVLVASYQIVNCFDPSEFGAFTAVPLAKISAILSAGTVDLVNANVRTIANNIFPSAGPTRAALAALWAAKVQKQSRATELGWAVTSEDLAYARTH